MIVQEWSDSIPTSVFTMRTIKQFRWNHFPLKITHIRLDEYFINIITSDFHQQRPVRTSLISKSRFYTRQIDRNELLTDSRRQRNIRYAHILHRRYSYRRLSYSIFNEAQRFFITVMTSFFRGDWVVITDIGGMMDGEWNSRDTDEVADRRNVDFASRTRSIWNCVMRICPINFLFSEYWRSTPVFPYILEFHYPWHIARFWILIF